MREEVLVLRRDEGADDELRHILDRQIEAPLLGVFGDQAAVGLVSGTRMLTARDWRSPADWVDTLLAPLAVGGSVVYVRNCTDQVVLDRRAAQERADVILT